MLFRSVAADIVNHESVVFDKGDVLNAVRASVSIPGIFTPYQHKNLLLVDGAVSSPLPMHIFEREKNEHMIAVNLNAQIPYEMPDVGHSEQEKERLTKTFYQWRNNVRKIFNVKKDKSAKKPGLYGVLFRSFEMMQESYTMELVERYKPDLLIELSRESADTFEFNKAEELIAYGRQQTKKALANE